MKTERFHFGTLSTLVGCWGLLVVTGTWWLYKYAQTPCAAATAPLQWPAGASLTQAERKASLVVFLHPHCPCSQATVSELERLIAKLPASVETVLVFWHPDEVSADWQQTPLWRQAQAIPRIQLVDDHSGVLTRQFGVKTSGQTLYYDAAGRLGFCGGITPARGHAGDNLGSDAILALVRAGRSHSATATKTCSVYGCPFCSAEETSLRQESK